jgi:hypothetical protein
VNGKARRGTADFMWGQERLCSTSSDPAVARCPPALAFFVLRMCLDVDIRSLEIELCSNTKSAKNLKLV